MCPRVRFIVGVGVRIRVRVRVRVGVVVCWNNCLGNGNAGKNGETESLRQVTKNHVGSSQTLFTHCRPSKTPPLEKGGAATLSPCTAEVEFKLLTQSISEQQHGEEGGGSDLMPLFDVERYPLPWDMCDRNSKFFVLFLEQVR